MKDHGTDGSSRINKDTTAKRASFVVRVHGVQVGQDPSKYGAELLLIDYLRDHMRRDHGWKGDDWKYLQDASLKRLRTVHEVEHIDAEADSSPTNPEVGE